MVVSLAPTRGALRTLRGVGLASTAASLSVANHAATGGALPGPGPTALITALLGLWFTALARRRRGTVSIVTALGLSQAGLHVFLQLTAAHAAGHQHLPAFDATAMLLGHTAAALLTGLTLARAEDAVFVLAWVLGRVLPRRQSTLPVIVPLAPIAAFHAPIRLLPQWVHQRIHALRGPPWSPSDQANIFG